MRICGIAALAALGWWAGAKGHAAEAADGWELRSGRDYVGVAIGAAIDSSSGVVYLATSKAIYEVRGGVPRIAIAGRPATRAAPVLAPGGGLAARLHAGRAVPGLFSVELMEISGNVVGTLAPPQADLGFTEIHIGWRGSTLVTSSFLRPGDELDEGRRYTFWSRKGVRLAEMDSPSRQRIVLAAGGGGALFLGPAEAAAYTPSGARAWAVEGRFRKAALAGDAAAAVLNPASRSDVRKIHVRLPDMEPKVVELPTPVHDLRMRPDGSEALVVGAEGRYFLLDPRTGTPAEGPPLLDGPTFRISDAELLGSDRLAFGVLIRERAGEGPWTRGEVIVTDLRGDALFRRAMALREATSVIPGIEAASGGGALVAFTDEYVVFIALGS